MAERMETVQVTRLFSDRLVLPPSGNAQFISDSINRRRPVPLLCFSVFMMVLFARQGQPNRQRGLKDTTRALALAIDQEIESSVTNLTALATSEPLDFGSVQEFRIVAGRFLRTQNSWKSVSLFDPRGKRLMSIAKPLSEDSSGISRENLNGVLRTRQPIISDFPDSSSGESGINIHVPVVREQTIIYVLTAAIGLGFSRKY
jgi:hypothetical protein